LDDKTRAALLAQIHAERPSNLSRLHPNVNTSYSPSYPPSLTSEHDRLQSGGPKTGGIDLSRYESLEPPNRTFETSDEDRPELLAQWRDTLRRAYASSTYLSGRSSSLALLETYGKNAWLVGNWQLEAELKSLEAELAAAKKETEQLSDERRPRQEGGAAEMQVLENTWKKGIGGLVEVQVATESLRSEVLEKRMEIGGS
jgi:pre-mRNA-splicing factor SPF27